MNFTLIPVAIADLAHLTVIHKPIWRLWYLVNVFKFNIHLKLYLSACLYKW